MYIYSSYRAGLTHFTCRGHYINTNKQKNWHKPLRFYHKNNNDELVK